MHIELTKHVYWKLGVVAYNPNFTIYIFETLNTEVVSLSLVQLLFFSFLNDANDVIYFFIYIVHAFWMILFLGKRWQLNATIEELLILNVSLSIISAKN